MPLLAGIIKGSLSSIAPEAIHRFNIIPTNIKVESFPQKNSSYIWELHLLKKQINLNTDCWLLEARMGDRHRKDLNLKIGEVVCVH